MKIVRWIVFILISLVAISVWMIFSERLSVGSPLENRKMGPPYAGVKGDAWESTPIFDASGLFKDWTTLQVDLYFIRDHQLFRLNGVIGGYSSGGPRPYLTPTRLDLRFYLSHRDGKYKVGCYGLRTYNENERPQNVSISMDTVSHYTFSGTMRGGQSTILYATGTENPAVEPGMTPLDFAEKNNGQFLVVFAAFCDEEASLEFSNKIRQY